jgi:ribonuclease VapC
MLVVDASALVAIGFDEPERGDFERIIAAAGDAFISPINLTEVGLALVLRRSVFTRKGLASWLDSVGIVETAVSGDEALAVYLNYGRGVHRAGLNLGDCYAYALARRLGAPLLFKGDDFVFTDVDRAYQPT